LAELEKQTDEPAKQEDPAAALARIDQQFSKVPTPSSPHSPSVRTEDETLKATVSQEPFWRKNQRLWLIVGSGGVTIVLVVGLLALLTPSDESNLTSVRSPRPARKQTSAPPPRLVFDWRPKDRSRATLVINGESKEIAPEGPLEFELQDGRFHFRIEREGFRPIEESGTLVAGLTRNYSPTWTPIPKPPASNPVAAADRAPKPKAAAKSATKRKKPTRSPPKGKPNAKAGK